MDSLGVLPTPWRYLSDEGIETCINSSEKVNTNDIILVALNTDLRTIGKKFLPSDINGGKVEKVDNIHFSCCDFFVMTVICTALVSFWHYIMYKLNQYLRINMLTH
ncbi:uncharacterized protein LOC107308094 isoform X2 [Coturnix japonica]|uniref:uncharacterized protein LOC107308094 isoform X2 n=1 Tax=Coturnix japonica TaxID=93934 RepID=UPI0013A5C28B|nr:uncharacterized protein LOC107308094 isoform X2 [Coturnix japonica]